MLSIREHRTKRFDMQRRKRVPLLVAGILTVLAILLPGSLSQVANMIGFSIGEITSVALTKDGGAEISIRKGRKEYFEYSKDRQNLNVVNGAGRVISSAPVSRTTTDSKYTTNMLIAGRQKVKVFAYASPSYSGSVQEAKFPKGCHCAACPCNPAGASYAIKCATGIAGLLIAHTPFGLAACIP